MNAEAQDSSPAALPRILFISPQPFFQWRGSPIRVRYNLLALSDLGYEVDLVTVPFGEDVELPHVHIHRVPPIPCIWDLPIGPSVPKLLFNLRIFATVRRLLRQHRYALVHAVEESAFFIGGLCRRHDVPMIYEKHSDPDSYRKPGLRNLVMSLYARMELQSMRRAGAVIATGSGLAEAVRQRCPDTPCTHLFDLPSSITDPDPDAVAAMREQLNPDPECVVAAYVGSFAVYQGIELLFDSIPAACRAQPNLRVVIVGGSEEEIAERRAALERQQVADRVEFLGKIPPTELATVLAACDILLSPRISGHNTPLKVLDYFRAGRAILATDTESNRGILDASTAVFAPPVPEDLGRALAGLASDAAERERLAQGGRRLIEETYHFPRYRDTLGGVYTSLLNPRNSS